MSSLSAVMLVVVLLVAVGGVHYIYFRVHFPKNTRFQLAGNGELPSDAQHDEHVFIDVIRNAVTYPPRKTAGSTPLDGDTPWSMTGEVGLLMAALSRSLGHVDGRQDAAAEHVSRDTITLSSPGEVQKQYLASLESISISHGKVQAGAIIARHSIMIHSSSLHVSCIESREVRINMEEDVSSRLRQLLPAQMGSNEWQNTPVMHAETFLPQAAVVDTQVVCMKDLVIERPVTFLSDVKVNGNLCVKAPVVFHGVVVVNGDVNAQADCSFLAGSLVKGRVVAGNNLMVGHPEQGPAALIAKEVNLENGLAAHGCIRSLKGGGIQLNSQAASQA